MAKKKEKPQKLEIVSGSTLPDNKPKTEPKVATVLEFTGKEGGVCHVLVEMQGIYSDFKVGQKIELK